MTVSVAGQKVGWAKFTVTLTPQGELKTTQVMKVDAADVGVSIETYDLRNGFPKYRKSHEKSGQEDRHVDMTFSGKSVHVVTTVNGKTSTKDMPYPNGNVASLSSYWFIRDTPKVGATETCMVLNENTLNWEPQTVTYKGDTDIKLGSQTLHIHKLVDSQTEIYLDSKGLPVKVVYTKNKMTLERTG